MDVVIDLHVESSGELFHNNANVLLNYTLKVVKGENFMLLFFFFF